MNDDLISRQALIDRLNNFNEWCKDGRLQGSLFAVDVVKDMPSVQPKQGEWEELPMQEVLGVRPSMLSYRILKCSVCRQQEFVPKKEGKCVWDYCPHCGAKMESEVE